MPRLPCARRSVQLWPTCTRLSSFTPSRDAGVVERTAIDRRVRADFDVVANFDDASLRKFPVAPFAVRVAEAIRADHCSGVNLRRDLRCARRHRDVTRG